MLAFEIMNTATAFLKKNTKIHLCYLSLLFFAAFYYVIKWPIFAGDTDLWYHLNGGRYILEHVSVPKDSFFSFISPPREWVDYYWLFQTIVYGIFSSSGYYGLIIFRVIVFSALAWLVFSMLFRNADHKRSWFYPTFVFTLIFLLMLPRFQLIRPHIFTYLFIAIFLYILEFKHKYIFVLPVIAVLWCNIHGVEYPVMLLIILSYTLEFFVTHIKNRTHIKRDELLYIAPVILCMIAVYLTPHGSDLTWVPFIQTGFASLYIQELTKFSIYDFSSFNVSKMSPSLGTIFNLIFASACLSVIAACFRKNIRISHFLLFIGGVILVTRGRRFMYEFALLSMPVINATARSLSPLNIGNRTTKLFYIIPVILLAIMPFVFLKSLFANPPRYPFSTKNLPHGIAVFLKQIDTGGWVLNSPNYGGYMQWMVYPKYKIFMDMEVPFLFTNEDYYLATNAFFNESILKKITTRYDPSYISVPIGNQRFKELIKATDYKPVFFDDSEVLYINRRHYPALVVKYELKYVDPFSLAGGNAESLFNIKDIQFAVDELKRVIEINPDCGMARQFLSMISLKEGEYRKAIGHADNIIKNYPELTMGYKLKGDAYKGLNMFDDALQSYKNALNILDILEIHREIGLIYFEQKQYEKAYNNLIRAVNVFSSNTSYKDLYYVIESAIKTDRAREAEILLKYAIQSVPADDTVWQEKYRILHQLIGNLHEISAS
jgi:hypothetical protein